MNEKGKKPKKTITVSLETHKELAFYKAEYELRSLGDAVQDLLDKMKQTSTQPAEKERFFS